MSEILFCELGLVCCRTTHRDIKHRGFMVNQSQGLSKSLALSISASQHSSAAQTHSVSCTPRPSDSLSTLVLSLRRTCSISYHDNLIICVCFSSEWEGRDGTVFMFVSWVPEQCLAHSRYLMVMG